jgi:hypothetical protein
MPKTYSVNGKIYDIPDDKAESFLSKYPNAVEVRSYTANDKTYDIPINKEKQFLEKYPNATPLGKQPASPSGNGGASSNVQSTPPVTPTTPSGTSSDATQQEIDRLQAKYESALKTNSNWLADEENEKLISLKKLNAINKEIKEINDEYNTYVENGVLKDKSKADYLDQKQRRNIHLYVEADDIKKKYSDLFKSGNSNQNTTTTEPSGEGFKLWTSNTGYKNEDAEAYRAAKEGRGGTRRSEKEYTAEERIAGAERVAAIANAESQKRKEIDAERTFKSPIAQPIATSRQEAESQEFKDKQAAYKDAMFGEIQRWGGVMQNKAADEFSAISQTPMTEISAAYNNATKFNDESAKQYLKGLKGNLVNDYLTYLDKADPERASDVKARISEIDTKLGTPNVEEQKFLYDLEKEALELKAFVANREAKNVIQSMDYDAFSVDATMYEEKIKSLKAEKNKYVNPDGSPKNSLGGKYQEYSSKIEGINKEMEAIGAEFSSYVGEDGVLKDESKRSYVEGLQQRATALEAQSNDLQKNYSYLFENGKLKQTEEEKKALVIDNQLNQVIEQYNALGEKYGVSQDKLNVINNAATFNSQIGGILTEGVKEYKVLYEAIKKGEKAKAELLALTERVGEGTEALAAGIISTGQALESSYLGAKSVPKIALDVVKKDLGIPFVDPTGMLDYLFTDWLDEAANRKFELKYEVLNYGENVETPFFVKKAELFGSGVGSVMSFMLGGEVLAITKIPKLMSLWGTAFVVQEGDNYQEALRNGLSPTEARLYSSAISGISATIELAVPDFKYLDDAVRSSILQSIKKGVSVQDAIKQGLKAMPQSLKAYSKNMLQEGVEEGVENIGVDMAKSVINFAEEKEIYKDLFKAETLLESITAGAMVGGAMTALNRPDQKSPTQQSLIGAIAETTEEDVLKVATIAPENVAVITEIQGIGAGMRQLPSFTALSQTEKNFVISESFRKKQLQRAQKEAGVKDPNIQAEIEKIDSDVDAVFNGKKVGEEYETKAGADEKVTNVVGNEKIEEVDELSPTTSPTTTQESNAKEDKYDDGTKEDINQARKFLQEDIERDTKELDEYNKSSFLNKAVSSKKYINELKARKAQSEARLEQLSTNPAQYFADRAKEEASLGGEENKQSASYYENVGQRIAEQDKEVTPPANQKDAELVAEYRKQEQEELAKAIPNIGEFDTYGEKQGNMPDDLYAIYKPIYDKYNDLITNVGKPTSTTSAQTAPASTTKPLTPLTTQEAKAAKEKNILYHGSIKDKDFSSRDKRILFASKDKKQANHYAAAYDGDVYEFELDSSEISTEQEAINELKKIDFSFGDEGMFFELIDPRFENYYVGADAVNKMLDALKSKGYKAIKYTDEDVTGGQKTINNYVLIDAISPTTTQAGIKAEEVAEIVPEEVLSENTQDVEQMGALKDVEVVVENNDIIKENKIEGGFLDEQQSIELQKEIESKYNTGVQRFGPENEDIRTNIYNYDNPLAQKNVNGVNLRIAEGLLEKDKSGKKRSTYLLYADGKIVGKFYSVDDIKKVVKFIENNLIKGVGEGKAIGQPQEGVGEEAETKQQIENFGVNKADVEPVHNVISQVFSGLKKAGLTAAKTVGDWVGIGKGEANSNSLDGIVEEIQKTLPKVEKKEAVKEQPKTESEPQPKVSAVTETDTKKQPINKIEDLQDVGEKIGGAKKDLAQKLSEVTTEDLATKPLSKVFPKPDFKKLVEEGSLSEDGAILLNFLYEKIPTKPRKQYRVANWVKTVDGALQTTRQVLEAESTKNLDFTEKILKAVTLSETLKRDYKLYSDTMKGLGFPKNDINLGGYEIKKFKRGNFSKDLKEGETVSDDVYSIVSGSSIIGDFKTMDDAINGLKNVLNKSEEKTKGTKFDIYQDRKTKEFFIGKKGAIDVVRVMQGFKTLGEARNFLKEKQADIQGLWDAMKAPKERRMANRPRVGVDWRKGKNVDSKEFADTFGFRGVEFGNWVNNAERQSHVNEAYDALMDLSSVLGVSPKALSLNGELGFAFGARGSGKANAHYEAGKVVINLTKTRGAGSLAHEWWHAMDNYFSRNRGQKESFITQNTLDRIERDGSRNQGVRKEMIDAFKGVMDAIKGTKLADRSKVLDRARSDAYWSTNIEMSARSFENYIIEKLGERNQQNDYLANFKETAEWINDTKGDIDALKNYPYPLAEESPIVNEKFKQFFEAIKEDESGKLFKDAEAQYRIENGKNIVEAIKDFNGSPRATVALTHEIMHPTVVAIIDGAKEGNEVGTKHTQTIVDEFNKANPKSKVTVDELIAGNDAFKEGTTSKQYRAVQEFIAESWEKYHTEGGKGFSEAFQKVLDLISEAFKSVYKSISGKGLTPELRKMFDEILGKEVVEQIVQETETQIESVVSEALSELNIVKEQTPVKKAKKRNKTAEAKRLREGALSYEPSDPDDAVITKIRQYFSGGGKVDTESLIRELGLRGRNKELQKKIGLHKRGEYNIERLSEIIHEMLPEEQREMVSQPQIRSLIIDVLNSETKYDMGQILIDGYLAKTDARMEGLTPEQYAVKKRYERDRQSEYEEMEEAQRLLEEGEQDVYDALFSPEVLSAMMDIDEMSIEEIEEFEGMKEAQRLLEEGEQEAYEALFSPEIIEVMMNIDKMSMDEIESKYGDAIDADGNIDEVKLNELISNEQRTKNQEGTKEIVSKESGRENQEPAAEEITPLEVFDTIENAQRTKKTVKGKKEAMEEAVKEYGEVGEKAIFVESNFKDIIEFLKEVKDAKGNNILKVKC